MAAPTAFESITTGDPGASGEKIANISSQEDASIEIVGGFALSDRIPQDPSAERAVTAADTATDMSDAASGFANGVTLSAINNRGALVVWCTFEATTDSATIRIVYYDAGGDPLFVGPGLSFVPLSGFHETDAGVHLSEPQIVESYGASKFRPYVAAKGDATNDLNVYVHPI